jgi:DNA-binding NarL/FixJ family response regulator
VRVLLADDDPHVRSALRLLLDNEPGITIVGDSTAADELIGTVAATRATAVLLDWDLPGLRPTVLAELIAEHAECRVLALSGRPEQRDEVLRAGVGCFVCKGDSPEGLLTLLRGLVAAEAECQANAEPEADAGRPEAIEVVDQRVQ